MGLRGVFKKAAQTIFNVIGDIPVVVDIIQTGDMVYDEDTQQTTTPTETYSNIKMVFGPYSERESSLNQNIMPTDIKALVPVDNIPIKPGTDCKVVVVSTSESTIRVGDEFKIIGDAKTDEAEAVYTVHLRSA